MLSTSTFRQYALALPDTEEVPHFDKPSFRWKNKIFATLWEEENKAMLKLTPEQQTEVCAADPDAFSPVPGGWGRQGATFVLLANVKAETCKEALHTAYIGVTQPPRSRRTKKEA